LRRLFHCSPRIRLRANRPGELALHELYVAENLLKLAERTAKEHNAKTIKAMRLIIGEWSGIEFEALSFCLEVAGKGTMAEDAAVEIESPKLTCRCKRCSNEFEPEEHRFACPRCGSSETEIVSGREIQLASIDLE
jgi:hydrogenase nickel incorporation protein HypA/HybF